MKDGSLTEVGTLRYVLFVLGLGVVAGSACSANDVTSVGSGSVVDQTNVEEVANAFVTAFLESDFDAVRDLVHPDQRGQVDEWIEVLKFVPPSDVELLSVDSQARMVDQEGDLARVEYVGRYCLAETLVDVPTTVIGDPSAPGEQPPDVIVVPERCFNFSEIFSSGLVEYKRVDGVWYAPLPT